MTTREAFLAKVRAAQPAARSRPDVPLFDSVGGDLRVRFTAALQTMGGTCVEAASASEVSELIRERFGVRLHPHHLLRWLRKRGITSQRVRRRPRGHDPQAMQKWASEQWPQIVKAVSKQGGRIAMIDETGMLMKPLVRASLAPRGREGRAVEIALC